MPMMKKGMKKTMRKPVRAARKPVRPVRKPVARRRRR